MTATKPPFPAPTKTWHNTSYPSISPLRPALSAAGKSVLITGGGTGIGAATAHSFAQAGAARIALLGRRLAPLQVTKTTIERQFPDTEVVVFAADVTVKGEVDAAFDAFLGLGGSAPSTAQTSADSGNEMSRVNGNGNGEAQRYQKLDILVHAAAIIGDQSAVADIDADAFIAAVEANLRGTLNVAQAFLRHHQHHHPQQKKQQHDHNAQPQNGVNDDDDAVIIAINSSAAHVDFAPAFAAYSVAKMAAARLWQAVAFAHAGDGVRVYNVHPGVVDTDMNREAGGTGAIGVEDHVSLPADFSVWLASQEARFLSGKFLWANWDVEELKARSTEIEAGAQLTVGVEGWPWGSTDWKSTWKKAD